MIFTNDKAFINQRSISPPIVASEIKWNKIRPTDTIYPQMYS